MVWKANNAYSSAGTTTTIFPAGNTVTAIVSCRWIDNSDGLIYINAKIESYTLYVKGRITQTTDYSCNGKFIIEYTR
jgi:hypothetical protein